MKARWKSVRGSLIIAALLIFALLMALGLGLLSSQSGRRGAAVAQIDSLRAKELALAAWADVKTKLGKDLFFPPRTEGQRYFSYGEDIYARDGTFYGTYSVVMDLRYISFQRDKGVDTNQDAMANVPEGLYLIRCTGKVGERGEAPRAERTMEFELAARTFKVIRMHDWQSL